MSRSFSSSFWPHTWEEDPRSPFWTVSIGDEVYGIYFPSIFQWIELLGWALGAACCAALFSPLVYLTLIAPRQRRDSENGSKLQHNGHQISPTPPLPSTTACLWTFGIFLPFWIFVPIHIINNLDCRNQLFRFAACCVTPTCSLFRILEALFGYGPYPKLENSNMLQYAIYFASPVAFELENNDNSGAKSKSVLKSKYAQTYARTNLTFLLQVLLQFVTHVFLTGAYNSCFRLLAPTYFPTFGASVSTAYNNDDWYSFVTIFNLRRQRDSLCYALNFQLTLTTYGIGFQLIFSLLTGRKVRYLMENPLLCSQSVQEFWGGRWNRLIHECLKNGVYKPLRFSLKCNQLTAVLAAFFASGLFHEWLLPCTFSKLDMKSRRFGGAMLFFLWQAGLIVIEAWLQRVTFVSREAHRSSDVGLLRRSLKTTSSFATLRTLMIVAAGLPLAHLFFESYVKSDLFLHAQISLPIIAPLGKAPAREQHPQLFSL